VLPPDLVLNQATGTISGTPRVATVFPPNPDSPGVNGVLVLFRVTDSANHVATRTLNLRIASPLAINIDGVPTATQGSAYTFALPASGGIGPFTWTGSGLPGWLTLSPGGTLSGTPPTAGDFTFGLTVTDAASPAQVARVTVTLRVFGRFGP
jgi:hypothetical protein